MVIRILFGLMIGAVLADEGSIIGCGGFVKSRDSKLKYDQIQVQLVNEGGVVKDRTECAPHNGYFFLPTYEQGNYKLRVAPPDGWNFEPKEYDITVGDRQSTCVDGVDMNFFLSGFTVVGTVRTEGSQTGPEGVQVTLTKEGAETVKTKTLADGRFTFSPVKPGQYQLSTSESDIYLKTPSIAVSVLDDNVNNLPPLVVAGYKVSGFVSSDGEPVLGVKFLLFPKQNQVLAKCKKQLSVSDGYDSSKPKPACFVLSDEKGRFEFEGLPRGDYQVIPFHKTGNTQFDVKPASFQFTVEHQPLVLPKFQVSGFSVFGSVINQQTGAGISDAEVTVNGKLVTKTDSSGKYTLEKMSVGAYTVQVTKKDYKFEPQKFQVTPSRPQLDPISAQQVAVCGKVTIEKFPSAISKTLARKIEISGVADTVAADESGNFCAFLDCGKQYTIKPLVTEAEKSAGLMFEPESKVLTVSDVTKDLRFGQRFFKLSINVACSSGACKGIEVSLKSVENPSESHLVATTAAGSASFDKLLPGRYTARVDESKHCWAQNDIAVEVGGKASTGVSFKQTGYALQIVTPYSGVDVSYKHTTDVNTSGVLKDVAATPRACLPKAGSYQLATHSCFKFQQPTFTFSTENVQPVILEAREFQVTGVVNTLSLDVEIKVTVNENPPIKASLLKNSDQSQKFSVFASKNDVISFEASSGTLILKPSSFKYTVSDSGCPGEVVTFEAKEGQFIKGTFSVESPDVQIKVVDKHSGQIFTSLVTSERTFSIGPLEDKTRFKLDIEKPGFIFSQDAKDPTKYLVHKLASISISVNDDEGRPLSGVLLSVSEGERAYRSNNLTNQLGKLNLLNLGPGEYYIKPLKKEYTFSPPNKLITVKEGENTDVKMTATRTAFTVHGYTKSLNGEMEAAVPIQAVGVGPCASFREEGVSQPDGSFTILGLQSNCEYLLELKPNSQFQYLIPSSRSFKVAKSDIHGAAFIALPADTQFDLSGHVIAKKDFLPTLSVNLYQDGHLDSPIDSQMLGQTSFFFFTSLTSDDSRYILRLESSLSKSEYTYNVSETTFVASGSSHHVTFQFTPARKAVDDNVDNGTLLVPLLIVLAGIAVYNYQKVQEIVKALGPLPSWKSYRFNRDNQGGSRKKKSLKSH